MKIFESEKTLAFLDIGPISKGHSVCFQTSTLRTAGEKVGLIVNLLHCS